MITVSGLFSYPVKSFRGLSHQSMSLDAFGPHMDRRFMVINDQGKHVTQRTHPKMALVSALVSESALSVNFDGVEAVLLFSEFNVPVMAQVWSDSVDALAMSSNEFDQRLSVYLNESVRLVFMPSSTYRQVDPDFSPESARVSFADGFPILLCSEASLLDLNSRLENPVTMSRFRPNIVISGSKPYQESKWRRIKIGEIEFDVAKPCSRCSMITLDEQGLFNKEPLKTLAQYRLNEFGACFGENLVQRGEGLISLGDSVEILE